jgi:next-to-BRCA1 protein 1
MHPSCPDFDLCQDCEALPIPVHPPIHPLLKMKTPDTVVPTVYRVGLTDLIQSARGCSFMSNTPPQTRPAQSLGVRMSRTASESSVLEELEPFAVAPESLSPVVISGQCPEEDSVDAESAGHGLTPAQLPQSSATVREQSPSPLTYVPVGDLVEMSQRPSTAEVRSPPPAMDASLDIFREMWPKVNREMKHLIDARQPEVEDHSPSSVAVLERAAEANLVNLEESADSTLIQEALLTTPASPFNLPPMIELKGSPLVSANRDLAALLHGYRTPSPVASLAGSSTTLFALLDSVPDGPTATLISEERLPPLCGAFVSDTTVPDGQIFPPGAEFVKSWRMVNDGETPWPEATELHFVAGESFAPSIDVSTVAKVGRVDPGVELDVWTGELKVRPPCLPQFVTAEVCLHFRHLMFLVDMSATGS